MFNLENLDIFAVFMFFLALFGLITARNAIKSIVFTLVMQTAVIMFWLFLSARTGTIPPIIYDQAILYDITAIADPTPQALMLTAIIIGISVSAIKITMLNYLFRKYSTADWYLLHEMQAEEEAENPYN
ncbi:MAG: cation:proton antiporter subunit C [Defluviitaleaceae bacterium]|nr:cation:proton antiporter subunit C [Defluviitaleaceae bacterium]